MDIGQIRNYVLRYLNTMGCQIIENHPAYVTVKLSPEADKDLTNRTYYWSFIERTGAEPETMTFTFIFDPDHESKEEKAQQAAPQSDSILGRYFGYTANSPINRRLNEQLTFGSSKLRQIFDSARNNGRYVHLYEQLPERISSASSFGVQTTSYHSYLGINYKIEYICDMKREELLSLGLSLSTGEIVENFQQCVESRHLTPRLPSHTHVRDTLTLPRAIGELEKYVEHYMKQSEHKWASQAEQRMYDELARIRSYYQEITHHSSDAEEQQQAAEQYRARQDEIAWQYKPRVLVTAVNCGVFHLLLPLPRSERLANSYTQ